MEEERDPMSDSVDNPIDSLVDNPVDDLVDNTDRNFRGQQRLETVTCFSRKHPIVLLRSFLIMFGMMLAASVGIYFILTMETEVFSGGLKAMAVLFFVGITLTHHLFFLRMFHYFLEIMIITNYRVIDLRKSVFLHDGKEIIDLHEIQDIKKNQDGLLPNLLNYGDIKIATASISTAMTLHTLPRPEYYLNQINQTKRHYILYRRHQKLNPELTRPYAASFPGTETG